MRLSLFKIFKPPFQLISPGDFSVENPRRSSAVFIVLLSAAVNCSSFSVQRFFFKAAQQFYAADLSLKLRGIMSSAADARAKERNRVKSGSMNGLGRLLIYRDKAQKPEGRPDDEATHWSQVNMKPLEHVPPGVEAGLRMTKAMRKSRVLLKEKGFVPMKAFVFCRVEEGSYFP